MLKSAPGPLRRGGQQIALSDYQVRIISFGKSRGVLPRQHTIVTEVSHVEDVRCDRRVECDCLRIIELPALDQVGRNGRQHSLLLQDGLSNNSRRGRIENRLRFQQLHGREQKRRGYGSNGFYCISFCRRWEADPDRVLKMRRPWAGRLGSGGGRIKAIEV